MNKLLPCFFFFISLYCFSQRETDNWFFGNKAGLNFGIDVVNTLTDGQMIAPAGCSSISDSNGNLLFYTNGSAVWNSNHEIMKNGSLIAGELENLQNSIIIKKPLTEDTFYIFTTRENKSTSPFLPVGLFFSEVSFKNDPLGEVTIRYSRIKETVTQRITAVHHKNGKDFWVITFGKQSSASSKYDTFSIFKINETGLIRSPITVQGSETVSTYGDMKVSPNGKYIAVADYTDRYLYIYNFNNETGEVTFNKRIITDPAPLAARFPKGVEFSIDSKKIFFSSENGDNNYIYEYRLEGGDLFESKKLIFSTNDYKIGSLQLSKNEMIYAACYDNNFNNEQIGSIENVATDFATFNKNTDISPNFSLKGLPNFVQSYFRNRIITENQCVFDMFNFDLDSYAPIASVTWDFGDGNTSKLMNPEHTYTAPGDYIVTATININSQDIPLYKKITVYPLPKLIPNQEIVQCDDDNDGVNLFNLYTIADKIATDTTHTYKFYRSLTDAQNDTNQISDPENFYNETNPQTIYTKVTSINGCSDIESFSIEALFRPPLTISPITVCRNPENSIDEDKGLFDLRVKKSQIISDLGLSKLEKVSFFDSAENAQKSINPLPFEYISGSTTIWVKIENENGCFGISPIDLIVNHPLINLQDNYTICISPSDHPAIILNADSSNDRFEWKDENNNTISTSNTFILTRKGEFSLTIYKIVNGIECSNSKKFTVNYPPAPEILNIEVNVQSETDNSVYISIDGDSSYEFSLDGTTYVGNGTSYSFNNVQPGIATIYIRDVNKCESPTKASASIVGYPKFLTPNADGVNDYWKVYGVSSNFFKEIDIKIFNRFGKILYVINDDNSEFGWDGTYNNIKLPSNDYWFHAKLKDLNDNVIDKKGHFTLKRN